MKRTLTTKKGKTIETTLTDREAFAILRTMETPTDFATKLLAVQNLTHDQIVWVHVLACEVFRPQTQVQKPKEHLMETIRRMIRARENGLKWPKIRLQTEGGERLVLSLTGAASKRPGTVNVTDGGPYPDNAYYGRIETNGELTEGRDITENILDLLRKFESDPA